MSYPDHDDIARDNGLSLREAIRSMMSLYIDEDPQMDDIQDTPLRFLNAFAEMTEGYRTTPASVFKTFSAKGYDQMVVVKDIPFVSLCAHHLLPFEGVAHVAYLPNERVVGLSKIPRLVDVFAKRLQIQERLTVQIATTLFNCLEAKGVGVVIEASHSCVSCRGVKKSGIKMVTSELLGVFRESEKTRAEFLSLVQ